MHIINPISFNILQWCHYFTGCDFYGFNASVAALAEIWSLAFVSFDRFLAIYFPLDRRKRITKSQVRVLIIIMYLKDFLIILDVLYRTLQYKYSFEQADVIILSLWGSAILFSVLPLAGWNKFVSEVRIVFKIHEGNPYSFSKFSSLLS